MRPLIRWGWRVLTIVTCVGSVSFAQQQQSGGGGSLSSGFAGGTTSGTSFGQNAAASARTSGVASSRLGTSSSNAGGLGTSNRLDRSSATNADNPRAARGLSVLAGDAGQQGQAGGRTGTQSLIGGSFGGAGQGGRSNLNNQRRQTANIPQYRTNMTFNDSPTFRANSAAAAQSEMASLQEVLTSLPQSSVHVATEEGVVVLSGTVATESDRRIAERMAKLHPGVDRIKNDLQIAVRVDQ